MRHHWQLNPEIDFLNHGSFGATPRVITQAREVWLEKLEADPIRFLAPERELEPKLDSVRLVVAESVGCAPKDLVFVRNATDGVNAVVQSFPLQAGDDIVITDHGYNACNNAIRYAADRSGATVRVAKIPFPVTGPDDVLRGIESTMTARTRLLVVDHVTSPTGLVFPIDQLIRLARRNGTRVLVDGAHAPGMLPLDLTQIGADYYTANHHKWWCAPKASGFLYVAEAWHEEVRPTVISHGSNLRTEGRSRFHAEFDWPGTYDVTPILCVPDAIDFLGSLVDDGIKGLMQRNHQMALRSRDLLESALKTGDRTPDDMIGSLAAVRLPSTKLNSQSDLSAFKRYLYEKQKIEAPVYFGPGSQPMLRVSLQAYNTLEQVERLADLLTKSL
ncbi:aminotransferase class V-fold PLP-dependent enzyme [Roseiconus lacunae]|uniref:Aminotransferase class V-fold PLP-dependent enzyme n=1 Tax=Roseiconus lacunae TaxID=2605694 RepID=A0ABT7PPY0_9BACT|nr:aminotransferase class V-fold PLP-dependent enzyme [Roseiconus lacunae]MDM4018567.1 aminotransferase class V-fold PLP-dependent enzyme [Roseiconus lacunae]